MRYLLTLLILAGLSFSASDTFGQLFRRTGCRPVAAAAAADALTRGELVDLIWRVQAFQHIDNRFNELDTQLAVIQEDTAYIRGFIEGQQATIQPVPAQQPQVLMVPSSGVGAVSSRVANTRPVATRNLRPVQLRPVHTIPARPITSPRTVLAPR